MYKLHRLQRKIIAYVMIALIVVNLFSAPCRSTVKAEEVPPVIFTDAGNPTCEISVNKSISNEPITVTYIADKIDGYTAYRVVTKDEVKGPEEEITDMTVMDSDVFKKSATEVFEEEGKYEISYYLKDSNNTQIAATANPLSFEIDETLPTVIVDSKEIDKDGKKKFECMVTADEPCTVTLFANQKTLDGENQLENEIVLTEDHKVSDDKYVSVFEYTKDGIYDVSFEAVDLAGNVTKTEDNMHTIFSIDNTKPELDILGIMEGEYYKDKELKVQFSVKDLNLSKEPKDYSVSLSKDGSEYIPQESVDWDKKDDEDIKAENPDSGNAEDYQKNGELTISGDGDYKFKFSVKDAVQNENEIEVSFIIDSTVPKLIDNIQISYENGTKKPNVENGIYYLNNHAKISFRVEERNYDTAEVYLHTTKDGKVMPPDNPLSMTKTSEKFSQVYTEEGNYISEISAKDKAGNEINPPSQHQFVIDKTKPVFEIIGVKLGEAYQKDQSLTITATDKNHKLDTYKITIERTTKDGRKTVQELTDISDWSGSEVKQQTLSFTEEGNYLVKITGSDKAGNEGEVAATSFRLDTTAPIITQSSSLKNGSCYNTSKELTGIIKEFNFSDAKASIEVVRTLDGISYTDTKEIKLKKENQDFSYSFKEEGAYQVTVKAEDKAGNAAENLNLHFVVDKKAPELSISGIPNQYKTKETVNLTYQAIDRNHDFTGYQIDAVRTNLDGEEETWTEKNWNEESYTEAEQKNYTVKRTISYTKEGNYRVTFKGIDKSGNVAAEKTLAFSIDHTAPIISKLTYANVDGLIMEKYGIIYSNKAILLEFDVWDSVAGVNDKRIYVTVGKAEDRGEQTPIYIAHKTIGNRYYVVIPTDLSVEEFDDTLTIWANDLLGNESHLVSSDMIYNTDYPNIVMDCDVDYMAWTNQDVTFHTNVSDSKSGLKEVIYRINGKEVKKVVFNSVVNSYDYDLTATESCEKVSGYKVSVEVTNNAGTTNTMDRQVFIDKVKPKVTLSGVINGTHYDESQTFVTDVHDVSYPATKTVYMISRTLDGKTYNVPAPVFHPKKYDDSCKRKMTREGKYKIYAITTDSAGNQGVSNILNFVVDKTAPKVSVSGTSNGSMNGTPVTLDFTCVESFFATNAVTIDVARELDGTTVTEQIKGFPKNAKKTAMSHTFSEDGTYEVTISAVDKAGNIANSKSITFSIDRTKPEINITGTDNYEQWKNPVTVRFSITESYYTGSSVQITGTRTDIDGNITDINISDFTYSGKLSSLSKLFEEDGIYELEVVSKDEAGNRESAGIHFIIDKTAPEINKVGALNGGYYQEFKLADSMEDVFKDLTVLSYHLLLNGVEYNGTDVIAEEGKYNLYVDAEDELGHVSSQNIEFIIDHTAPKVIFTGAKDGESVHDRGEVQLSLTNAEDKITAVRMNGADYGADTRNLAFTEYGSYRIEVDCEDKAGNTVTRSIYFVYNNPVVIILLFGGIGSFIVIMCIWLILRTKRKEAEERKNK